MLEQSEKLRELRELKEKARQGGDPRKAQEIHEKGRMTARERIQHLLDPGSFTELDSLVLHQCKEFGMESTRALGDGLLTGHGKIDGRLVYVFAHDATIFGGSTGETSARKIRKVMEMAIKAGAPVIGLMESAGIRVQEGLAGLAGLGDHLFKNVIASGVIPQISAVMGPCAGPITHSSTLNDFVLMVKGDSHMFAAGPDAIESPVKQGISLEELGGATMHCELGGVAHVLANNETDCLRQIRRLLSHLPSNNLEDPPRIQSADDPRREDPELDKVIPENPNEPYDMKEIILSIVDGHDFFEIHQSWAQNIIVGFARISGNAVGIVGNQPKILGGALDSNASVKAARFTRFCDAFNIPVVTLVDTPGFLPGVEGERDGIARHGSKLLYAYSEATVPKVSVITRKAYGAGYVVMSSKQVRGDINYAWPSAEIAVMGPQGAVRAIFSKDIYEAANQEARVSELTTEYRNRFANAYVAAERGYVDDVIAPRETRPKIVDALEALKTKRENRPPKKHGNIPL